MALVSVLAALAPLSTVAQTGEVPSAAQPASAPSKSSGDWFTVYLSCTQDFVGQRWQQSNWAGRRIEELSDAAAVACARVLPAEGSVPTGASAQVDGAQLKRARQQAKTVNERAVQRNLAAAQPGMDPDATLILPPPRVIVQTSVTGCPSPAYPNAALRAEAKGTTVARLHVDKTGNVTEVVLAQPSGETREHRLLDKTALEAFKGCRFAPGGDARWVGLSYVWDLKVEPGPPSSSTSPPAR
jgi:TonB family protein